MSIKIGSSIPTDIKIKVITQNGQKETTTNDLHNGKILFFGLPGAFTPICHKYHLKSYLENIDKLKKKGIEDIYCLSVNDPFVLEAWVNGYENALDHIKFIADGNGELTQQLKMDYDCSFLLLGIRCQRFVAVLEDGVVQTLMMESNPAECYVTHANHFFDKIT